MQTHCTFDESRSKPQGEKQIASKGDSFPSRLLPTAKYIYHAVGFKLKIICLWSAFWVLCILRCNEKYMPNLQKWKEKCVI